MHKGVQVNDYGLHWGRVSTAHLKKFQFLPGSADEGIVAPWPALVLAATSYLLGSRDRKQATACPFSGAYADIGAASLKWYFQKGAFCK